MPRGITLTTANLSIKGRDFQAVRQGGIWSVPDDIAKLIGTKNAWKHLRDLRACVRKANRV
jgi:hypothetical protein